jgi:hypothetical protein
LNRNSSTSSSEPDWRKFSLTIILGALLSAGLLYLSILIIDPYDSVPFSPGWDRYPPRGDHRHWNAKLLQQARFDSLVIGTSTAMLLKPDELNRALGGRFVNLSMPLSTAWEQMKVLELFHYHHPRMAAVVADFDFLWCHAKDMPEHGNEILRRGFPERLYDTQIWNDLPPFNKTSLKAAYDQARALLGIHRPYERWLDGYEDNSKTLHASNDPAAIHRRLYESTPENLMKDRGPLTHLRYPSLEQLDGIMRRLPPATLKIMFFPPLHQRFQPKPGSSQEVLWNGCKSRAANLARQLENAYVVDFLLPSPITRDDGNYIDGYHYTPEVAGQLAGLIGKARSRPEAVDDRYRVLASPRP